jgi:shikimate dehydrogenase
MQMLDQQVAIARPVAEQRRDLRARGRIDLAAFGRRCGSASGHIATLSVEGANAKRLTAASRRFIPNPMALGGNTRILAHIGYPTATFRSPAIYNPYFEMAGIDARVVPMGVRAEDFAASFPAILRFANVIGALITMPHKIAVVDLLDEVSAAVRIAGSCNAVRRLPGGKLEGDMFDGEGFVRGLARKGIAMKGASALVVGAGGVGSAIGAALAGRGLARLALFDPDARAAARLAERLTAHYPAMLVKIGAPDPRGHDIAINASPLGMNDGDPLPFDVSALDARTLVADVVLKAEITPLLAAAQARSCAVQTGLDMLYEQIPAYLEFFGLPATTPDVLRALTRPRP